MKRQSLWPSVEAVQRPLFLFTLVFSLFFLLHDFIITIEWFNLLRKLLKFWRVLFKYIIYSCIFFRPRSRNYWFIFLMLWILQIVYRLCYRNVAFKFGPKSGTVITGYNISFLYFLDFWHFLFFSILKNLCFKIESKYKCGSLMILRYEI